MSHSCREPFYLIWIWAQEILPERGRQAKRRLRRPLRSAPTYSPRSGSGFECPRHFVHVDDSERRRMRDQPCRWLCYWTLGGQVLDMEVWVVFCLRDSTMPSQRFQVCRKGYSGHCCHLRHASTISVFLAPPFVTST